MKRIMIAMMIGLCTATSAGLLVSAMGCGGCDMAGMGGGKDADKDKPPK